jgi:hypothetical protein
VYAASGTYPVSLTVTDNDGGTDLIRGISNPVANATVYISWSGVLSGSFSGITGADGTVTFKSAKVKSTGPFIITVDNVTHATYNYNPALNVETSDSITY